jgi:hypothetical protein
MLLRNKEDLCKILAYIQFSCIYITISFGEPLAEDQTPDLCRTKIFFILYF